MTNAGVSLLVGVIITYFIAFMRMSDKARKNKDKDEFSIACSITL
jgi:uncharacterized protein YneF (UPF0154 family)